MTWFAGLGRARNCVSRRRRKQDIGTLAFASAGKEQSIHSDVFSLSPIDRTGRDSDLPILANGLEKIDVSLL
jgi:hypothetical protein